MVTIADVAKQAGVSMMTVSRVINKNRHVSEKTRKAVELAIEQLNYHPNMIARSLATNRNHMIAYVMSDMANPFFANVNKGIQHKCMEHGYTVIVYDVSSSEQLEDCINMLIDRRIDGIIFHHLDITAEHVRRLQENGLKCVTIDNEHDLEGVTMLLSDNYLGARTAARHLIERGHTRIGCIHGILDDAELSNIDNPDYIETFQRRIWRDRTQGFLDELHENGLEPACMILGRGTMTMGLADGISIMQRIANMNCELSALYCENDVLALGVLGECLEKNVRVPQDLSIVGHDGINISLTLFPRVTTIKQPKYEMGCIATEKLIHAIEQKEEGERIETRSELVVGDTT